ncbi:MAG: membrane protein insertase YidC [Eubacterium sp.]|nr:membrane protein insertase YidC [Eubacterium sp.]
MSYIASAFGVVFKFCYSIGFKNYLVAVVLFTILSKIILLPVSIWTQKNSIKMVIMQPRLNMIKVKYFGDKDKIADETTELYKKEHYNPFLTIIPTIIQIALLLGIIHVVRNPQLASLTESAMEIGGIRFQDYPNVVGGAYLIMPFLAGLSALILGLAQNKLNPLQAEQSGAGQISTLAISVGISLVLGFFVPMAVGFYWICSNLFTIVQQVFLNLIINPNKYIDHEALEDSRKQLNELEHMGSGEITKEQKAKEKADYKRFFSVANKHLVFYSEKNGFYKYFEDTIKYLLEHTNVTIHYVTSDPNDQIFEMEKENPHIRGYYIGEKKLITLMMKMDADMVVMTMSDLENYHIKRSYVRKDVEYVYMFHYPLSTHMVLHTGALDHYDTILCVGEFQIPEIRKQEELHKLPEKKLVVTGYGQLEKLQASYDKIKDTLKKGNKILIAPSWQEGNILDSCIDEMLKGLLGKGFNVHVRPHPEYVKRYGARMDAIVKRYEDYDGGDLEFELDFTRNDSIFDSDVAISDWSGTTYEFSFVTGKPCIFIDTPMKVNNPNYKEIGIEPLEISLRDKVGIRMNPDNLEGIADTVRDLIDRQDEYIKNNIDIRNELIANYGHSGEESAKYIIGSLKEMAQKRKNEK